MSFQINALPSAPFEHLFGQDDHTLSGHGVQRLIADQYPSFPCRISLEDVAVGERVLLLNFQHQPAASPYRSSHAIFIREGGRQARLAPNEVPDQLRRRLLSVRAFDKDDMIIDGAVVEGEDLEQVIESMLADASTRYLHIHFAKRGCYAARVDRC